MGGSRFSGEGVYVLRSSSVLLRQLVFEVAKRRWFIHRMPS